MCFSFGHVEGGRANTVVTIASARAKWQAGRPRDGAPGGGIGKGGKYTRCPTQAVADGRQRCISSSEQLRKMVLDCLLKLCLCLVFLLVQSMKSERKKAEVRSSRQGFYLPRLRLAPSLSLRSWSPRSCLSSAADPADRRWYPHGHTTSPPPQLVLSCQARANMMHRALLSHTLPICTTRPQCPFVACAACSACAPARTPSLHNQDVSTGSHTKSTTASLLSSSPPHSRALARMCVEEGGKRKDRKKESGPKSPSRVRSPGRHLTEQRPAFASLPGADRQQKESGTLSPPVPRIRSGRPPHYMYSLPILTPASLYGRVGEVVRPDRPACEAQSHACMRACMHARLAHGRRLGGSRVRWASDLTPA